MRWLADIFSERKITLIARVLLAIVWSEWLAMVSFTRR